MTWDSGWPLHKSNFHQEGAAIAQAIRDGTAQGVCDGSYKPKQADHLGAAGWVIKDSRRVSGVDFSPDSCLGIVRTTGIRKEVNAYRSELQGIHTMLLATKAVCIRHNVLQGTL